MLNVIVWLAEALVATKSLVRANACAGVLVPTGVAVNFIPLVPAGPTAVLEPKTLLE